ncbi:MAG TPA: NAD kinase [Chryseosolibacter sp.]
MRIGIHGKEFNRQTVPVIQRIFENLSSQDLYISEKFAGFLKAPVFRKYTWKTYVPEELSKKKIDLFLSVGGDGTLLETISHIGKLELPVLGINTGRLGFLATTSKTDIDAALQQVLKGQYNLDKRAVLRLETNGDVFGKLNFALNDFTIVKKDTSSMITIHTTIDGEFLNSYWADGIIVATPTGSTGYSLSCGGPLIFPRSGNFVITPVSPHTLTVRPIIVSDSSEITFRIEGRSKRFLVSLDSRMATIDSSVVLTVKKADFKVVLVQLEGQHYFKTLRQKLNWGLDIRN